MYNSKQYELNALNLFNFASQADRAPQQLCNMQLLIGYFPTHPTPQRTATTPGTSCPTLL